MSNLPNLGESSTRLNICLGQLPELWGRNVHYFSNVLGMFFDNEEQIRELQERVGGVEFHGGRLLPILDLMFQGEGENILYLERQPDPILSQYLRNLGLSLPRLDVLSRKGYLGAKTISKLVNQGAPLWIDGYVTDGVLDSLAKATGKKTVSSYRASRKGNNKGLLHEFIREKGLPVFSTRYADSPSAIEACLDELRMEGFAFAVVKSVIGASGVGMCRVPTAPENHAKIQESFFYEGPCMVQGWLDESQSGVDQVLSPSVQVFLTDEVISLFDITEQFLSGESVFKGNECPPSYLEWSDHAGIREELLLQAEIVAHWLHDLGLRGPASIDFLVTRDRDNFQVYVCEANARVTGATYPSLLARHFQAHGAWVMRNLRFTHPVPTSHLLKVLSQHHYLFEPGRDCGVMPYNLYTCDQGNVEQGQFLIVAPEITTCKGLLLEAERDLPLDWEYERA